MGKCRYCGCTDGHACVGGCTWTAKNVCSNCILPSSKLKGAFNAYASDPETASIELVISRKKSKQIVRFLIIK